jgi:hypothetical protein
MVSRSWLERVDGEMVRRGVPAGRRSRLLAELCDHLEDLTEGGKSMSEIELNEVVGRPEALAERALTEYRKESWIRRHPLCVFGFTPLPAALLGLTLYVLLAVGASWLLECCFGEMPVSGEHERLGRSIITAYAYTVGFVPFAACAVLFGRLAVRSKVSRWWLAVAVAQVGIVAWLVVVSCTFSDVPGQSQLMIGLRLPLWSSLKSGALLWALLRSPCGLLQLALPLAVGIIYLRAGVRRVAA